MRPTEQGCREDRELGRGEIVTADRPRGMVPTRFALDPPLALDRVERRLRHTFRGQAVERSIG
jgi:hypothetical protein